MHQRLLFGKHPLGAEAALESCWSLSPIETLETQALEHLVANPEIEHGSCLQNVQWRC